MIGYGKTDMKMTSKKDNVFIITDPWKQEALLHGEYQCLWLGREGVDNGPECDLIEVVGDCI